MTFVGPMSHFFNTPVVVSRRLLLEDNNHMRVPIIVIAILCLSCFAFVRQAGAGADLSDLSWLAGNWTGVQDGLEMEELWLAPKGNTMLGVHRDMKNGHTVSFEFFRVEAAADGITYWASPGGRPATPFHLIESSGKRVVFENAEHDFPQRIIYWLADDNLHAKIEGKLHGKTASEEWSWQRSPAK